MARVGANPDLGSILDALFGGIVDSFDGSSAPAPRRRRRRPVAAPAPAAMGPFRSQSSDPRIRAQATPAEHGRPAPAPIDNPFAPEPMHYEFSQPRGWSLEGDLLTATRPEFTAERNRFLQGREPSTTFGDVPRRTSTGEELAAGFQEWQAAKDDPTTLEALLIAASLSPVGPELLLARGGSFIGSKALGLLARGGEEGAERAATSLGARAAEKLRQGAVDVATSPVRAAQRVGQLPGQIARAPGVAAREVQALATAAGRREAAARAASGGLNVAARHPFLSTGGAAAALGSVADVPGANEAAALVEGHVDALLNDPGRTLQTTGRALAGSVASLGALGYAAGQSAFELDPDPLIETGTEQWEGLKALADPLLSGDPDRVQSAVEDEVGLSLLPLVPSLRGSRAYESVRGGVRDYAQALRGAANERYGTNFRYSPDVEQHVFGPLERRAQRREEAVDATRTVNPEKAKGAPIVRQLEAAARKLPLPRKLSRIYGEHGGDAMQVLAEFGFRDPETMARFSGKLDEITDPAAAGRGDVNLATVRKLLDENPQIFGHTKTEEIMRILRENEASLGHGNQRASRLAQAKLLDVLEPEYRTPVAAREFTSAPDREGAWAEQKAMRSEAQSLRKRAKALRTGARGRDSREIANQKRRLRGMRERSAKLQGELRQLEIKQRRRGDDAPLYKLVERRRAELADLEPNIGRMELEIRQAIEGRHADADTRAAELEAEGLRLGDRATQLHDALAPYARPGAAISSRAQRKLWDDDLEAEFAREVDAAAAEAGLAPAIWTGHAALRQEGETSMAAGGQTASPTTVPHVRRSPNDPESLAARDSVARDFRSLLNATVRDPRAKSGNKSWVASFFNRNAIGILTERGGGRKVHRVTRAEFAQAIKDGQISAKGHIWVPEREYKQAFNDPYADPGKSAFRKGDELEAEVSRAQHGEKGEWGVIVERGRYDELRGQLQPERWVGEKVLNAASKTAGRVLLFSPGWVTSQLIAEALPMIMANPRLLNPAYVAQLEHRLRKMNDISRDEAVGFGAVMGESHNYGATAKELGPAYNPTAGHFYNAARAIEHNPIGRALFSTARMRPLVVFDQWRQGKYRKILAAAEVDRRLNGFLTGLQQTLRTERRLSDELRHMDKDTQLRELATNPKYKADLDKIADYVDDIAGNWTAFTRFERVFGPAAVFYGFIRYAMRWPLTFAKHHPVAAEVSYFLGQQNAEQLDKILGGEPTEFYKYAQPVVWDGEGEASVLPGGARISPGLSAPAQGLLTANAPAAAIGSLNPALGAGVGLFTGRDAFGNADDNEGFLGLHWSLAAKQLMSMPPIMRTAFGWGRSHSETAEQLRALDPNRDLRSIAAPWLPQSGGEARASEDIIRALEEEYGGGDSGSANRFLETAPAASSGNRFLDGSSSSSSSTNRFLP